MKEELLTSFLKLFDPLILVKIVVILIATWFIIFFLQRLSRFLSERFPRRRVQISSVFPVLRLFVWIAVMSFIVVAVLKPEINTLVAIFAAAGVTLGFGAQELVKNVLAGIVILLERPYRVGDMIGIDSCYGEVTNIGLRATEIHTFSDSTITLPNAFFLEKAVTNANSGALSEQVVVELVLPGSANVREIKALAHEAAICSPYVFRKNPVVVLVEDMYDRAFLTKFVIKAYVIDVRFEKLMASDIVERLKEAIAAKVSFPAVHI